MEEQKPRIQSSLPFHHPLARQLYSDEYGSAPVVESNVVPMPTQNTITEDERLSHNASKRKQRGGTEGKTRAATGSKKTFKTVRQSQSAPPYPYADEVKRLEDHAKRINQILADCAHKEASREPLAEFSTRITETADVISPNSIDSPNLIKHSSTQSQTSTSSVERQVEQQLPPIQPCKNQWHSSTPIQKQTVETLKTQNYGVHQRLIELGLHLNEASRLVPSSEALSDSKQVNFPQGQFSVPPAPIPSLVPHSPIQWEETPKQPGDEKPLHTAKTESFPHLNEGISTNRKRSRDPLRSRSSSPPITLRRYLREGYKRLSNGRSLKVPRQPINRISDAALWIATFAIVRVAFRYGVAVFPMLSPIFLMLMLAPAIAAVYLAFCVPKAGRLPYYRLFLMMVGFLVGGKL